MLITHYLYIYIGIKSRKGNKKLLILKPAPRKVHNIFGLEPQFPIFRLSLSVDIDTHTAMILDVARHKFYEGFFTLAIMTIVMIATFIFCSDDVAHVAMPDTPFMALVASLTGGVVFVEKLAAIVLYMASALTLARSAIRTHIYTADTMAPLALCAVVMMPLILVGETINQSVVVLLLSTALGNIFYCFGPHRCLHHLFVAMVAAGILAIAVPGFVVITLALCIALILARKRLREATITVAGMLLPMFVQCYVLWLMGDGFTDAVAELWRSMMEPWSADVVARITTMIELPIPRLVFIAFVIIMQLTSSVLYLTEHDVHSPVVRGAWRAMHFIWIVTLATTLLSTTPLWLPFTMVAVVSAVMLPMFFIRSNMMVATLVYLLLIASAIAAIF